MKHKDRGRRPGRGRREGSRSSDSGTGARKSGRLRVPSGEMGPGGQVIRLSRDHRARRAATSGWRSAPEPGRMVGRSRVRVVLVVFALVSLLLGGRAVHMNVADGERFQALAAEPAREEAEQALERRGSIISADGRELATSLEMSRVVATPYQVENPEETARKLLRVIGPETEKSAEQIEALLKTRDGEGRLAGYSVVETVKLATAHKVEDLKLEGIFLEPAAARVYPDGPLASQVVGYLGSYGRAFGGVEARYDAVLKSGEDVRLTLDSAVQQQLQGAIDSAVEEYDAKQGLGIVMRVEDGAIVALANSPTYDNNRFNRAPAPLQRNRVLTDPYEPGSTFKPFTVAAALENNAITQDTTFSVPDSITVADRIIHDSLSHETRVMSVREILAESSNVGMIKIARRVGGERLDDYIGSFGFGEPTGVDLWGEDAGTVPSYEDWSGASIGNIPIGQGLAVTPLQLAAGYATLANGGREVIPYITERGAPEGLGARMISEETSDIVRGMLRGVVEQGTGHLARIPGYTVAGKTGTSQKVEPETGTYGDEYVASFVGFAPASDPKYVTLIVVDEPQKSIWGERVAAPAFEEVMSFALSYFNVPPDRNSRKEDAE